MTANSLNINRRVALLSSLACFALSAPTHAQVLARVRLDQRLGETVPLDAAFTGETGQTVALSEFLRDRPVVLVPVFYRCPMLCSQVLSALIRAVNGVHFTSGKEFRIVVFSIDPREAPGLAVENKLRYLHREVMPRARQGWHFLTADAANIQRVTESIGYHFVYDERTGQFAHPAAVAVLTPDGRVSRYLVGLDYRANDLRLALVEAGQGAIGSIVDKFVLRCYRYDPIQGRYGFAVMSALRIGAGLTVVSLAAAIFFLSRRRRVMTGRAPC